MQIGIDVFAAAIREPRTRVAFAARERMVHLRQEITLFDPTGARISRFTIPMGVSTLPHAKRMHAIELPGERLSRRVREELPVSTP